MTVALVRAGVSQDRRVALSSLDAFEYPIPIDVALVYRDAVDVAVLEASFRATVAHYPELAGRLVRDDGALAVACDDSGAGFSVQSADVSVRDLDEDALAALPMARYFAPNKWLRARDRDVPLLVATVTRTACGGMVLGVEVAHCLADGEALVQFVRNWARVHRGEAPALSDQARDGYDALFQVREPRDGDPDRVPGFKRMSRAMLLWKVLKLAWDSRSTASVVLPFSRDEVAAVREVASSSSSTALLAHVWHVFAGLRPNRDDDRAGLFLVVGTRHLADCPVDRNYAGNAVWHVRADATYGDVRTASLADLAARVQAAQASVSYADVCTGMQWLANERTRGTVVVPDYELMRRDFFATNLTPLRLYEPDFGAGTPVWVTTKAPPIRWMIRLFPRPGGGVAVHCTVPRRWKKLLATDEVRGRLHRYAEPA